MSSPTKRQGDRFAVVSLQEACLAAVRTLANEAIARGELTRSLLPLSVSETRAWAWSLPPRFASYVAVCGDEISGFAVLSRFYQRPAYDRTAEITLLVAPEHRGSGIGTALYERVKAHLVEHDFHLALTALFDEPTWVHRQVANAGFVRCGTLPAVTRPATGQTGLHLYRAHLDGGTFA